MMRLRRKLCVLAVLMSAVVAWAVPQTPTERIRSAIDQARAEANAIGEKDTTSSWQDVKADVLKAIEDADTTLADGRIYLAIERLGIAKAQLRGYEVVRQTGDKLDMPRFDAVWKLTNVSLEQANKRLNERDWNGVPAAVQAQAEAAQGRPATFMEGSRGFAEATGPDSGIYYLGQAVAFADWAEWIRTIELRTSKTARFRSVLPELEALQRRVNAAFQAPRSIDKHKEFIRVNSTLKYALELDAAKLYRGALYQYLDATQQFAMLMNDVDTSDEVLQKSEETAKTQLAKSEQDDSIAQLFVERAAVLMKGSLGRANAALQKTSAAAILERAIPAYADYFKSAGAPRTTTAGLLDVTLVRWPYT